MAASPSSSTPCPSRCSCAPRVRARRRAGGRRRQHGDDPPQERPAAPRRGGRHRPGDGRRTPPRHDIHVARHRRSGQYRVRRIGGQGAARQDRRRQHPDQLRCAGRRRADPDSRHQHHPRRIRSADRGRRRHLQQRDHRVRTLHRDRKRQRGRHGHAAGRRRQSTRPISIRRTLRRWRCSRAPPRHRSTAPRLPTASSSSPPSAG